LLLLVVLSAGGAVSQPDDDPNVIPGSLMTAPAGDEVTTREIVIDGISAAILPNGRRITPAGVEVSVDAPKPYGLVLAPAGDVLATINSGASRFSVTLLRSLTSGTPTAQRVNLNATFMGVVFSPNGARFYAAGGENGNIWVGDTASGTIIGSVNLNGAAHPLDRPLNVENTPALRFKGAFPGNMALSRDGRYLYVVDQGSFQVFVVDTTLITTGTAGPDLVTEPDNFQAVVGTAKTGRYPYGISLSPDGRTLYVTNVGVFQYTHLTPASPTGDPNHDYPLCYPAAGYPDETEHATTLRIKPVDPRHLPDDLRDPEGVRCGYVDQEQEYVVPGLGSPNVPEASSTWAFDLQAPAHPQMRTVSKTGPKVGQLEDGIRTYGSSHPNSVAVGRGAVFVANGNNDTVSVLDPLTRLERSRIPLTPLRGVDARLKGVLPVALALSPDETFLYVAEAGINAVAVVRLHGVSGEVVGQIPTAWWPAALAVSADGRTLYVANSRGRGAGANVTSEDGSPKHSTIGSVSIIPVPSPETLERYTRLVVANNGFNPVRIHQEPGHPIPVRFGERSQQIHHVIFINKENSTHDQMLGDVQATRRGVPVRGEPAFGLGYDASPNHHELALGFAFSDNFYLEPTVSSDGHRWLTSMYPTEFEETHWPASYGGRRRDAGDDPDSYGPYPGRLGFTDANGSPAPDDYNQHGGVYLHLARHGRSFVNFGNGYEFAIVDEDGGTDPTGIRQHVNVPMEKVVRDNSDHLYPEFNTHIPDAPLAEDPTRFSRFGRFKQVFESRYVDRRKGECRLPEYVDLYYPNDHGGGAFDINPAGPAWSYRRFVQDNDIALGMTVDLISHSPCWKDTVIFVVEDDTQNGLDHIDGYRSLFLAIGPWVKREYVSKTHTSLMSVFKTVDLILGVEPLNQYDAAAADLRDLFTPTPDFTPYTLTPVQLARGASDTWLRMTKGLDFSDPDESEVGLRTAILASEGLPRRPSTPRPSAY
jgi:DNA-binding beta-propeller fold protein YncE